MKKLNFILIISLFLAQICFANVDIEKIYDKHQIVYLPLSNIFATGSMQDDKIVLTKETSSGTGGFSTYFYSNKKTAFELPSNFEFIKNSRLFACDNANLKYYEIYYKNKNFHLKKLSFKEVKKLFPNAKVIKISKFKNGKLSIKSKKDYVLLFNDTNEFFHRYSTTPKEAENTDIKGLIDITKEKNITFSHFEDDNEIYKMYKIIIK